MNALDRWLRRQLLQRVEGITGGRLRWQEAYRGDDQIIEMGDPAADTEVHLQVHDWRFYRLLASGGSIGAAEAFVEGFWQTDNLTGLVRLILRNRRLLGDIDGGWTRFTRLPLNLWHAWNRNSLTGSRRNIAAHYDLSNELFETFLDKRMIYSAAVFDTPHGDLKGQEDGDDLDRAQRRKLHLIGDQLRLGPDDHLLEIGGGWGGLAIELAKRHGSRVTAITLSAEQLEESRRRAQAAGLADKVKFKLQDYRRTRGKYDKLVSIEMVEAVGHQYLGEYFRCCRRLLKDTGAMLLQSITIDDGEYRRALREVDFIKRYIFPGGFLPSVSVLTSSAAAAGLRLVHLQDIGDSYARTLREWSRRFQRERQRLAELGFDTRFMRLWHFYFSYCEGAFLERAISDVQMLFNAPGHRRAIYPSPEAVETI